MSQTVNPEHENVTNVPALRMYLLDLIPNDALQQNLGHEHWQYLAGKGYC
jgi:hypothetical protein